ncbi:MAG: hypothetical protein KIT44_07925 [Opitutaceae bacterium]|nr:hypothetical protein [Opitutaceae bacterium]
MRTAALLALCLALAGCSTQTGRGSRLLPWNWFAPDRATQLEQQQQRTGEAEKQVLRGAQEDVRATGHALAGAEPSRAVDTAKSFNAKADAKLGQALGSLTAEQDGKLLALVLQLTSELAEERAAGAAELRRRDSREAAQSAALAEAREREAALTAKLVESDGKYQAQAEQARRWKFWIFAIVGGWIGLQVLAGLSRFFPNLAPVSHLAGSIAAPAVQAAYNRVTTTVGRAIADAEKAGQGVADTIRGYLDGPMDAEDQGVIHQKYKTAPRT